MPLIKSGSKQAISTNISEMIRAGHPRDQAIAAALSTARRYGKKYAEGGDVDPLTGAPLPEPLPRFPQRTRKDTSVDDDYVQELSKNLESDNPISGALREGVKGLVEYPGKRYQAKPEDQSGPMTEEEAFRINMARHQDANWGAGTALGMVGMGRLPGAAPEGALGIHGGDLHSPQRPPQPMPQAKYGTPEWEDQLFGHLNNAMAGKNAAPELNQSLNELYHGITGKEIPKDSPIAPAPKATQGAGPTAADWEAASKQYEQVPYRSEPEPWLAGEWEASAKPSKDDYIGAGTFEKVGPQKGSNPGGVYQDPKTGEQWYVKVPKSRDHADNEILAARLYELAGVPVPEIRPTMIEGKPAIASKIIPGTEAGKFQPQPWLKNEIGKDMPVDAWLANWDAIGTGKDNVIFDNATGRAHRIDMGGSLRYRAQGAPKGDKFGSDVSELKTFLDPKINPDAADIFGGVDKGITFDAVKRLEQIEPGQIAELVDKWGPRDQAEKVKLFNTLVERKQAVVDDFYQSQQNNLPKPSSSLPHTIFNDLAASAEVFAPDSYAKQLVTLASEQPDAALKLKNSLPPDFKKEVNKELWSMTKKTDSDTKAIINNLYSGKVKTQAKAAGLSDKDYLASLKQKKEAYKTSQEKSDAEWAKEQAEYEGNQSAKEIHEEQINTGNYAAESDKQINPSFKSAPQTEERFKEVARPIKNWQDWTPPEYPPEKQIPRPRGPFKFPNAVTDPASLGYNTKVPLYKGGHETWHGELFDPAKKYGEKAWFAAHHPTVASAYGKPHTYFAKPNKVIELNWPEFTGYYHYGGTPMERAINLARKEGADLLVLHNMVDMAGWGWGGEPHTQFAILNTKGVRHIEAKFDPSQLHLRHSHAGLVGGGLLGYGLLGQKDQGDGMKKGGRTPMAAGGFNASKWIPRPSLGAQVRPVGGAMPRAIAPKPAGGLIHSSIPGRTDKIPMNVKGGSYIMPASVVSGMGQGNTLAGADALNKLFSQGPYGDKMQKFGTPKPNFGHPMRMAAPQMRMPKVAAAGGAEEGDDHVPIIVAGGEYQVPPEVVQRLGGGNMKRGHQILDELVMHIRRQTIKDMKAERPPKK
jgi:hypothetical protein